MSAQLAADQLNNLAWFVSHKVCHLKAFNASESSIVLSLKRTFLSWNLMVGRLLACFGARPISSGELLVSGSVSDSKWLCAKGLECPWSNPRQPTDYFIKKQFELFDMIQAEKKQWSQQYDYDIWWHMLIIILCCFAWSTWKSEKVGRCRNFGALHAPRCRCISDICCCCLFLLKVLEFFGSRSTSGGLFRCCVCRCCCSLPGASRHDVGWPNWWWQDLLLPHFTGTSDGLFSRWDKCWTWVINTKIYTNMTYSCT